MPVFVAMTELSTAHRVYGRGVVDEGGFGTASVKWTDFEATCQKAGGSIDRARNGMMDVRAGASLPESIPVMVLPCFNGAKERWTIRLLAMGAQQ